MEDPLQLKRLQCVIDGYKDDRDVVYEGMLSKEHLGVRPTYKRPMQNSFQTAPRMTTCLFCSKCPAWIRWHEACCFSGVIHQSHQSDSSRSYQCIKFLVSLANKCCLAKDYLMQSTTKWQWAVNWLKKKVNRPHWWTLLRPVWDLTVL